LRFSGSPRPGSGMSACFDWIASAAAAYVAPLTAGGNVVTKRPLFACALAAWTRMVAVYFRSRAAMSAYALSRRDSHSSRMPSGYSTFAAFAIMIFAEPGRSFAAACTRCM